MKLVIVDEFLEDTLIQTADCLTGTHLSDRFYEGDLAYWIDEKGRKLYLTACGEQRSYIDVKKAIQDKVDVEWLYEYEEDELEDRVDIETYDWDSSRCVFKNGDVDEIKLRAYTDVITNNWVEISFSNEDGFYLFTDCMEADNVTSIFDFVNMPKEDILNWMDWFENESSDGERLRNGNNN